MGCGASGVHVPTTAAWLERLTRTFYRETRFLQFPRRLAHAKSILSGAPRGRETLSRRVVDTTGCAKGEGDKPPRRGRTALWQRVTHLREPLGMLNRVRWMAVALGRGDRPFKPRLYAIATNLARDHVKSATVRRVRTRRRRCRS